MNRKVANIVYLLQNIAVPVLVYFFVARELPLMALITVALSKWRVFAAGYHFWLPNLRSNAADIMVGVSTVILMSTAPTSQGGIVTPLLAALYGAWLLFLKPRSGTAAVVAQALIGQFYAITSLYLLVDGIWTTASWLVVPVAWVVGRLAARHFLSVHPDISDRMMIISLWGFIVAQLAWVFWVWNVIYTLPIGIFSVPLISLVITIFSYAAGSIYHSKQLGGISRNFIIQQSLFVVGVLALIIVFTPWTGQV